MTLHLRYTEQIIRDAVREYLWREHIRKSLWLLAVSAILPLTSFLDGNIWFHVLVCLPITMLILVFALGYRVRIQQSLKKLAALENAQSTVILGEATLTAEAAMGKTELKWQAFTELWESRSAYLLLFTNRHFRICRKSRRHLKPRHSFARI